ncbi:MAG: sulfatase [Acidobacteria bacterium]|nr:sulfatase [Acidobacteriota bacterium]
MLTRRALLASGVAASATAQRRRAPNFLILFTDDQRFDTIAALGHPEVRTPNMDRLVRSGMAFRKAHIMGGTIPAVCAPSRAMLITGQALFHIHRSIIAPNNFPASERRPFDMFPEVLRKNGWATFATGKWHNGGPLHARAFSHGASIFLGGMQYHDRVDANPLDPTGRYPKDKITVTSTFSSQLFADAAIDFLKNRPQDKPFLLYTAFTSPHDPRMAPKPYSGWYSADKVALPKNFLPQHPFDNGELKVRDELLAPFPRTPEDTRKQIAEYYAMISEVDAQIGRILDALEASGDSENTYVVFAADNGLAVGHHGLMGKQNLYDHSVRVPLIIRGPGIPKNSICDALCYLSDVCPTVIDLSGSTMPDTVTARSLRPLFTNPRAAHRDSLFFAYRDVQRGVTQGDWKLILYNVAGKETVQLFDLKSDPFEMNNLAAAQPKRVAGLRTLLQKHLAEAGDRADVTKPGWGLTA